MADELKKTALQVLRDAKKAFEEKVTKQQAAILKEFEDRLEEASELYEGLVSDCKMAPAEIADLAVVRVFLRKIKSQSPEIEKPKKPGVSNPRMRITSAIPAILKKAGKALTAAQIFEEKYTDVKKVEWSMKEQFKTVDALVKKADSVKDWKEYQVARDGNSFSLIAQKAAA